METFSKLNLDFLKSTFYFHPDIIYVKDKNNKLIFSNESCYKFIENFKGTDLTDQTTSKNDFWESADKHDIAVLERGEIVKGLRESYSFISDYDDKKETIYLLSNKSPIYDNKKNIIGVLSISTETTEIKKEADEIRYHAYHDSLTGFLNRKGFKDAFSEEVKRATRYDFKIGIVYFDIDKFKSINDKYGHIAGDSFLVTFCNRLKKIFRETDHICRYGGDEFIVLITAIKEKEGFRELIDNLIDKVYSKIADPVRFENDEIIPSVSAGYSVFPDDAEKISSLIHQADLAMYNNKRKSKKLKQVK